MMPVLVAQDSLTCLLENLNRISKYILDIVDFTFPTSLKTTP